MTATPKHPEVLASLFEQNQEWARVIARNVHRKVSTAFDIEDLEQVAVIAMWKFCEKYDPLNVKGVPFQGFAYLGVRGAVLMHCRRRAWKDATQEPLDTAMVSTLPDPETRLEMRREVKIEGQRTARQLSKTKLAIEELPSMDAYIVSRHFLDGVEIDSLAQTLGMERRAIAHRLSSIVRRLKKSVGG